MSKSILAAFCMQIVLWRNIKIVPRLVLRPNYDPGSAHHLSPVQLQTNLPSRSLKLYNHGEGLLKGPTSAFTL